MSRWDEPFGKMESDMSAQEKAAMDKQRALQKAFEDGDLSEDELVEIFTGNWVDVDLPSHG